MGDICKVIFLPFTTRSFTTYTQGIISSNFETFKASLERGQTQPATILKNSVKVDLVYEGMKYCVRATQTGKSNYLMELGHSKKDVEASIIIKKEVLIVPMSMAATRGKTSKTWVLPGFCKIKQLGSGDTSVMWLPL